MEATTSRALVHSRSRSVACLLVLIALFAVPLASHCAAPSWWGSRGVTLPGIPADDFAILNQGQLKNLALGAYLEFDARLRNGAGADLTSFVSRWTTLTEDGHRIPRVIQDQTDNFAVVNLGQLKAMAKPFYDRLNSAGLVPGYPWIGLDPDDFVLANVGQAKALFAFSFTLDTPQNFQVIPGDETVQISWDSVLGAEGYTLLRLNPASGVWQVAKECAASENSFNDTSLVNGLNYSYYVYAYNSTIKSVETVKVSASPLAPPLTPTGLIAYRADSWSVLDWNTVPAATSYRVFRSLVPRQGYEEVSRSALNKASFLDTGLDKDTTYYYVVYALRDGEWLQRSAPLRVAPRPSFFDNVGIASLAQRMGKTLSELLNGDLDGDGLSFRDEILAGTMPSLSNPSGDGLLDGLDHTAQFPLTGDWYADVLGAPIVELISPIGARSIPLGTNF